VQLSDRVLTNFEINLAPSLLNFVRQAVPVPFVFLKFLQTRTAFRRFRGRKNFSTVDPYSYWTIIILEVLGYLPVPSPRFTPRFLIFGGRGGVTIARFSYFSGTCKNPSTQTHLLE
jgi:hypothetical protein